MKKVAVVGVSGYTGIELIKMLINHPYFEINYVATTQGGVKLSKLHPSLEGVYECNVEAASIEEMADNDLVFLALPHKAAMEYVEKLSRYDVKIVDFSADYRLTQENYEAFYCPHTDRENLKNAVYGLPEIDRESIKQANLVANPGCYPTAVLLGLLPFRDRIEKNIFIDAKSGVSGAGKKLSESTHFVNVNENVFAYNPIKHRHGIEIKEKAGDFNINFVPNLLPVTRGMLASIFVTLKEPCDAQKILQSYYEKEPFIRIRETPVTIKSTSGTHFCDIFVQQNEEVLFINTSIDNLLRGASSQALANANLMCGFEEGVGIPVIAYVP